MNRMPYAESAQQVVDYFQDDLALLSCMPLFELGKLFGFISFLRVIC